MLVEFRGDALTKWAKDGIKGKGFEPLADGRLIITQSGAQITGPALKPGKFGTLHVQFVPNGRRTTGARVFELDVTELDAKGKRIGGQRFLLKTTTGRKRPCWDNQLGTFDGVTWMPKTHGCCS